MINPSSTSSTTQPVKAARKILNDPLKVADELFEGLVLANDGKAIKVPGVNAIVRADIPEGKVTLLVGGGSGHEPLFHGFVGLNMADGAACGDIFAAPSPDVPYEATKAIHRGKGVLYLYGNYAGDAMNFDMAAEMAAAEGIRVETVLICDDVTSAPPERASERRGIAGDLYMIKIAGGAAATYPTLDEVVRVTRKASDNIRSLGVALAAGSIPQTGEPTFLLPEGEIEIGMGVHGEPGVGRQKMASADALTAQMLERILADLPFKKGDSVCLLINSLGSTTMMECLIVNRAARAILAEKGISVHATDIGPYVTCQEMAGFSITLMRLDDELRRLYDMPADSVGYRKLGA
jgi:dihydroxyacetone kinase-like protein